MATDGKVNRWNGVEYEAVDERRLSSALLLPGDSNPFSARAGRRVNGAGLSVSLGGSPEAWTVTAGAGVIYDPTYAAQGPYEFEIPSSKSGNMPARPGVGLSRIDLVVARIYDSDIPVGSVEEVKIELKPGTAASSPTAPTPDPLSLVLATLNVPASGSITITPSAARTVAAGGVLPVATTTERDALVSAGIAYKGMLVDNAQTNAVERYTGSGGNWDQLAKAFADTGWTNETPVGPAWEEVSGYQLESRLRDGEVTVNGMAKWVSGLLAGTTILTLPSGRRPPKSVMLELTKGSNTNCVCQPFVSTGGVINIPTTAYWTGSPVAGMNIKISGKFRVD